MKDRRSVDELTIEELEEILRLRKRQARLDRLRRMGKAEEPKEPPPVAPLPMPRRPRMERRFSVEIEGRNAPRRRRRGVDWGWVGNRLLTLVEIAAVVGLVLILIQLTLTLRQLNEESASAMAAPTPTPTPIIGLILPGGHTPPDAEGHTQPEEIPPHLRPLVEAITPLPVPTPGPEQARRIIIPAIGVDAPVVEGDDWESLKKGAGHHIGSANPGERGNCVISAHDDVYGEIFRDLPKLKIGDEIFVETETQRYRYVVQQTRIIEPTEVSVMAPTRSPVLTLISCYPYGVDTHRIVVIASLEP